ncbi:MAG TPA: hypothetical protein VFQ67_07790 [Allosphingosinicella sp.]|jgi:hypothetical protein|nr:hypothetical protein [Allosphingosinicella sp.]
MKRPVALLLFCGLFSAAAAQSAPRSGVNAPEKAAGNPDKVVCKRFVRVGSLVDGYRTCKTKREWERERENARTVNWSNPCNSQAGEC